jgi:hypothetical protein
VRQAAVKALGQIDDAHTVDLIIAAIKDKGVPVSGATDGLVQIGAPAVEPLIAALKEKDSKVRHAAVKALGLIGDAQGAVEPLIAALNDENIMVRRAVIGALEAIGDPRAEEGLAAALNDENESVRKAATKALGKIKGVDSIEPLIVALSDPGNAQVRRRAAESLGKIKDPRAVEPLIAALTDKTVSVRKAAIDALKKIGDPRAIVPLLERFENEPQKNRQSIVYALDKLGWEPDQGKAGAWYWMVKGEWEKCAISDTAAIEPLLAALDVVPKPLRWNNSNVRMGIAQGRIDPEEYRRGAARMLQELYRSGKLDTTAQKAIKSKLGKINAIIKRDFTDPDYGRGFYF